MVDDRELHGTEAWLGFELPQSLRSWYTRFSQIRHVWNKQDSWRSHEGLSFDRKRNALIFRDENQACVSWGVLKKDIVDAHPDPPVWSFGDTTRMESNEFSNSAITSLLIERAFQRYSAWAELSDEEFTVWNNAAQNTMTRCQDTGKYWFTETLEFYEADDVLYHFDRSSNWILVSCRTEAAFNSLDVGIRDWLEPTWDRNVQYKRG